MVKGLVDCCKSNGHKVTGMNSGVANEADPVVCDLLFSFCLGQRGSGLRGYIEKVRQSGRPVFIGELGFFDRGAHFGITKLHSDGVHNRDGEWLSTVKKPDDRFKKHGLKVTTAKTLPKHAVILGQVDGDTQVDGVDLPAYYDEQRAKAEAAGYEVTFRPHPRVAQNQETLQEIVARSGLVMSYNSTGLIEAILQGVPFECSTNCQYHPLSGKKAAPAKDRKQFLHNLAYMQFNADEYADGTALAYIEERLNG